MRVPWPVPIRLLFLGCACYAVIVAGLSWAFTLTTGLSRWTMTPAGPARWYGNLLLINLAQWCGWAALAVVVFFLGRRVPFGRAQWRLALAVHVVASFVVASLHGTFVSTVRVLAQTWWGLTPAWWPSVLENFFRTVDSHVPIYWALLGLQHAVDYHRALRDRDVAAATLETRVVEAQLQALHRQLHPHFLFNTLHAVSALVHRSPEKAEDMLERLSEMLRVTLSTASTQQVPLRRELDFLRAYLDLEQVNFGDRLRVKVEVPASLLDASVPTLLLQPLAENALRHGLAPKVSGGTLVVTAGATDGVLTLEVIDDGVGPRPAAGAGLGVGLSNSRARLAALYGTGASLDVVHGKLGGTHVTVRLPYLVNGLGEAPARRAS